MVLAAAMCIGRHRVRRTGTRTAAKVAFAMPDQVTPHRTIDTQLAQNSLQLFRYLGNLAFRTLHGGPLLQSQILLPIQIQKTLVTGTHALTMNFRVVG